MLEPSLSENIFIDLADYKLGISFSVVIILEVRQFLLFLFYLTRAYSLVIGLKNENCYYFYKTLFGVANY